MNQSEDAPSDPMRHLPKGEPVILPERKRARNAIGVSGERGGIQYRSLTDPLDFYVARGQINERQYDAGEKFSRLWRNGTQSPYAQARYGCDNGTGGPVEFLPVGMFAVKYREALSSVRGRHQRTIVHAVCCEGVWASQSLRFPSRRTGERRGMELLKSALDDLAAYFRIEKGRD